MTQKRKRNQVLAALVVCVGLQALSGGANAFGKPEVWARFRGKEILVDATALETMYHRAGLSEAQIPAQIQSGLFEQAMSQILGVYISELEPNGSPEEVAKVRSRIADGYRGIYTEAVDQMRSEMNERLQGLRRWDEENQKAGGSLTVDKFFQDAAASKRPVPGFANASEWQEFKEKFPDTKSLESVLKQPDPSDGKGDMRFFEDELNTRAKCEVWTRKWLASRGIDPETILSDAAIKTEMEARLKNPPPGYVRSQEQINQGILFDRDSICTTLLQHEMLVNLKEGDLVFTSPNSKEAFMKRTKEIIAMTPPKPLPPTVWQNTPSSK